jgi:hypothetical protein
MKQATIGDALIFMTKMVVGSVVLIALALVAGYYWMLNNDAVKTEKRLASEALKKVAEQQTTIASLGDKLNACFTAGAGQVWTDDELNAVAPCPTPEPCKPWERAWWP